ncbi:MAG: hypothetical protein RSC43_07955 [Clostridia bacterium]
MGNGTSYAVELSSDSARITPGDSVTFKHRQYSDVVPTWLAHDEARNITITEDGTYSVWFSVTSAPAGAVFAVFLDEHEIPGTRAHCGSAILFPADGARAVVSVRLVQSAAAFISKAVLLVARISPI